MANIEESPAGGEQIDAEVQPFGFNHTFRDGIQANLGTNPSADEMLEMFMHTADAAYAEVQAGGGTFMDLFMKKGRDAWGENEKLFGAYSEMVTSALIRGDCLLSYKRNPQDVIDAVIEELAERGLKKVTNFHGDNYTPMQEGVFKAVQRAREKGYDITAPKVVCIEDNPRITIDSCMESLRQQAEMDADEGIYLKNASGKCDPEFVYELVKKIAAEYPDETITMHAHNNHGLGETLYFRAAEAAVEMNAPMNFDVSSHPMSNGTGQPSAPRFYQMLKSHPSEQIQARVQTITYDEEKEKPDYTAQYEIRHQYADAEVRYSKRVWDACFVGGLAGGAMSAIKGMGIPTAVDRALKLGDEDEAFALVAEMEAEVKVLLGYPTSVTPTQKMMDEQSGMEVIARTMPNEAVPGAFPQWKPVSILPEGTTGPYVPFSALTESSVYYLSGGLGPISPLASSKHVSAALQAEGMTELPTFPSAEEMPQKMHETKALLEDAGYEDPSQADVALAAMYDKAGFDHVIKKRNNELKPQQPPEMPAYLQKPNENYEFSPQGYVVKYDIAMALGGAAELERFAQAVTEMEKHADGFYKTGIGPTGVYQRMKQMNPAHEGLTNSFESKNSIRVDDDFLMETHARWAEEAKAEVQAFMASIPQRLKEYGMTRIQAMGAFHYAVPSLLAEVVERKAKGGSQRSLPKVDDTNLLAVFRGDPSEPSRSKGGNGKFEQAANGIGNTSWPHKGAPGIGGQVVHAGPDETAPGAVK